MDRFSPADAASGPAPDFTDPVRVAQLLEDAAGGLDQQATAAQQGSALGGHPFPAFFYGNTAHLARAAAHLIRVRLTGADGPAPAPTSPVATAPLNEVRAEPKPVASPDVKASAPVAPEVVGSLPSGDERAARKSRS